MRTADVAAHLDDFFRLDDYPAQDFAEIVQFCDDAGIPLAEYYFCQADSIEPHRLGAEFRRQLHRILRFRAPAQP